MTQKNAIVIFVIVSAILSLPSSGSAQPSPDTSGLGEADSLTDLATPGKLLAAPSGPGAQAASSLPQPPVHRSTPPPAPSTASTEGEPEHPGSSTETSSGGEEVIYIFDEAVTTVDSIATKSMRDQQSPITSINALIDNMPGVIVNEGDVFGSDDWSTMISVRGFQTIDQHLGTTIDGLPNGNSGYGGGSRANRYIDAENLSTVAISRGISDIGSPSNEALGGTLSFTTDNPRMVKQVRANATIGTNNARRLYVRADSGEFLPGAYAYFSYSHTFNNRWIDNTSLSRRDHVASKLTARIGPVDITARYSYNDANEGSYNSVSLQQFEENPSWDRLTSNWTGVPETDQYYGPAWVTLRTNHFAYLKAETERSGFRVKVTPYYHRMTGRGDWIPPYILEIDGQMPTFGQTIYGGSDSNRIYFADADGTLLAPVDGCTPQEAACYEQGASPVSSYRHTHYHKQRYGALAEVTRDTELKVGKNHARAGLWYERSKLQKLRDWHKVLDSSASHHFAHTPYWVQWDRRYNYKQLVWYLEDKQEFDKLTLSLGARQFLIDLDRRDEIGLENRIDVNGSSNPLFSGEASYRATSNITLTAGYAQTFAGVRQTALDTDNDIEIEDPVTGETTVIAPLDSLEPETASTLELGVRMSFDSFTAVVAAYDTRFDNRITQIRASDPLSGIDYTGPDEILINIGGIKSQGVEAAAAYRVTPAWTVYGACSWNNAKYRETVAGAGIFAGNKVALFPEHMAVVSLDYDGGHGLRSGISGKYVGEQPGTTGDEQGEQEVIPDYTVLDFYLGYATKAFAGIDITLRVNNLTDRRYISGSGNAIGRYLLGGSRTTTLTVSSTF